MIKTIFISIRLITMQHFGGQGKLISFENVTKRKYTYVLSSIVASKHKLGIISSKVKLLKVKDAL